ncbi:MAG: twin-arginine translocase subunit TatC [Planctomycetota bacterium]|jgi:sec-independent protein translocase protein TatC
MTESATTRPDVAPDERRMTIGEHLEELRKRVTWALVYWLIATLATAYWANELMGIVLTPFMEALQATGQTPKMIWLHPADSITVVFKFIAILGAFFAAPFITWEIWGFISAGLYGREKKMVRLVAPISYLLFASGTLFFYLFVLPQALTFLFEYGHGFFKWQPEWATEHSLNIKDSISFYLWMSLSMGVVFQLPLVMYFLNVIGLMEAKSFSQYRRHFILGATVVAAVVTPTGDAVTLSLFMIPIIGLFELGLLAVRLRERGRRKETE